MATPNLSDPNDVRQYLSRFLVAARDALDDGGSWAETTLQGQPFDPWMWCHLARYRAYNYLNGLGPRDWALTSAIPNSGIEVAKGPVIVRVLKSLSNAPPPPGSSGARQQFYQQWMPLQYGKVIAPSEGANLILDWNISRKNFDLTLALSKPTGVWSYRGKPHLEWRRFITFDDHQFPRFIPTEEPLDFDPSESSAQELG